MEIITNLLSDIPPTAFYAVGGATVISVLLQILKNWLALQNEKLITFILGCLSFLAVGFDYLTAAHAADPSMLGVGTAAIMGLSSTVYHYAIKPATKFMTEVKEMRETKERLVLQNNINEAVTTEPTVSLDSVETPLLEDDDITDNPLLAESEPTPITVVTPEEPKNEFAE